MIRAHLPGRREALVVAALLGLYIGLAGWALARDASVADEHPHLLCGVLFWQSGRFSGGLDNPPLGQLLLAAPIALGGAAYEYPSDTHLARARIPVLLLGIALALVVWAWGRSVAGAAAGAAALAAFALEPNLLAHGHLATLDMPLTVLWWAALWALRRELVRPPAVRWTHRLRRALPFAVLVAVAALTKFSGVVLLPAAVLIGLAVRRDRPALAWLVTTLGLSIAVTWLLSHLVYGFGPTRAGWPEPLLEAVAGKLAHRDEVRFAYLAGRRSESGFPVYYLAALGLKTPLPLLALAAVGAWVLARRGRARELVFLLVPAALLVGAFTLVRVNIGLRHVLPVLPAFCILAGVGATALARARPPARVLLVLLVAGWLFGLARAAPQWIAYFNVLAGGPVGGHRYLLDSNLDWGQDDRRLTGALAAAASRKTPFEVLPDPLVPKTGRLAVNANSLHNLQRRSALPYAWLRALPTAGTAGFSWRLYDLDAKDFLAQADRAPEDPIAAWAAAEVVRASGDSTQARVLGRAALGRLAAPDARALLALLSARSALRRGEHTVADEWVRDGLAAQPADPDLQQAAVELQLERQARSDADPHRRARAALELGLARAEAGKVDEALPWLVQATALAPADLEAARLLAVARARQGNWQGALEILDRPEVRAAFPEEADFCAAMLATERDLIRSDPDPELLFELGRALFEANEYDRAAAAFLRQLESRPGDRLAVAYLGEMQVRAKTRLVAAPLTPRSVRVRRASR